MLAQNIELLELWANVLMESSTLFSSPTLRRGLVMGRERMRSTCCSITQTPIASWQLGSPCAFLALLGGDYTLGKPAGPLDMSFAQAWVWLRLQAKTISCRIWKQCFLPNVWIFTVCLHGTNVCCLRGPSHQVARGLDVQSMSFRGEIFNPNHFLEQNWCFCSATNFSRILTDFMLQESKTLSCDTVQDGRSSTVP